MSTATALLTKLGNYNGFKVNFETLLHISEHNKLYQLRGVVVHHGEAGSGHYTSFVRMFDDRWYECDDFQNPRVVSEEMVLRQEAYILVYEAASGAA